MALLTLALELSSSWEFGLSAPLLRSPSMSQPAVLATGHLRPRGRRGRPVPAPTLTAPPTPRRLHCGIHPATVFVPERCCDFSAAHGEMRTAREACRPLQLTRDRRREQVPLRRVTGLHAVRRRHRRLLERDLSRGEPGATPVPRLLPRRRDDRTTRRELKAHASSSTCESVRVGGCETAGWALVVSCVGGHDGGAAFARRRLSA